MFNQIASGTNDAGMVQYLATQGLTGYFRQTAQVLNLGALKAEQNRTSAKLTRGPDITSRGELGTLQSAVFEESSDHFTKANRNGRVHLEYVQSCTTRPSTGKKICDAVAALSAYPVTRALDYLKDGIKYLDDPSSFTGTAAVEAEEGAETVGAIAAFLDFGPGAVLIAAALLAAVAAYYLAEC